MSFRTGIFMRGAGWRVVRVLPRGHWWALWVTIRFAEDSELFDVG